MIELLALIVAVTLGTLFVLGALVILPIWLLFKIVGFGLRITFGVLGLLVGGLVVLPVALLVGGLLLIKLLVLGLPLLLFGLLVWAIVAMTRRRDAPTPQPAAGPPAATAS